MQVVLIKLGKHFSYIVYNKLWKLSIIIFYDETEKLSVIIVHYISNFLLEGKGCKLLPFEFCIILCYFQHVHSILNFEGFVDINQSLILRLESYRTSEGIGQIFLCDSTHYQDELWIKTECERIRNLCWHFYLSESSPNMQLGVVPFY